MQAGIRCMLMRGGTSKGVYFLAEDLPQDRAARDRLLLAVMGSPDARQIDGLGGGHPLTSKVAIVARAATPGADIDFLFAQVGVETPMVDTTPNCGNILAGVGPFAIERGLIAAGPLTTRIKIRTINTGTIADVLIETPDGRVNYGGSARIDGVPGTAAPIAIDFLDAEGSVCGALLPTGNTVDTIDGVACTLIDNGMPVIVLRAADVGRSGREPRDQLNSDGALKARLERIRRAAGPLMTLGNVTTKAVPKLALVSEPSSGGHVCTRSFIPHECHASIGVFAAVTVATACLLPGSPAASVARVPTGPVKVLSVEHPTGEFTVRLEVAGTPDAPKIVRAGLLRTARLLFDGTAYVDAARLRASVS